MKSYKKILIFQLELVIIILILVFNIRLEERSILNTRALQDSIVYRNVYEFKENYTQGTSPKNVFAGLLDAPSSVTVLSAYDVNPPLEENNDKLTKKDSYIVAVIGDSMVETMGDSIEYLQGYLKKKYPDTNFVYYNYGVGAENVESALLRFDKKFDHGNRSYGPLSELKPDILIIGSFAYNPFPVHDRNKHWSNLSELVGRAKGVSENVYLLAEIAPLEDGFGKGVGGVNWPEEMADEHTVHIIEQLENAIILADTMGVDLINAYSLSRKEGSKYGEENYVDKHDGIHPSIEGHEFTAKLIANKIKAP